MRRHMQEDGFTLIELMLVVVIIGILAAIVMPRLVNVRTDTERKAVVSQLKQFDLLLYTYQLNVGSFPTSQQGLRALIEDPGAEGWLGPYIVEKHVPRDPWGNPYVYVLESNHEQDYDLHSWGPDGLEATRDDIGNWMDHTRISKQ